MSDDLIRRQDALDAVDVGNIRHFIVDALQNIISEIPSAQPERCEDCRNFNKARLLISQPERKKGKWKKWWEVKQDEFGEIHIPHWACAECGTEYSPHLASAVHYCANCGVEMEVEETDERT